MKRDLAFKFTSAADWTNLIKWLRHYLTIGLQRRGELEISIAPPSRNKEQNRRLWPTLRDIAQQIDWPRGTGQILKEEDWKLIFVSAWRQETNFVPGLNGEFLNLSLSSSELSKTEFSELLALIEAQGSEWGVRWSDPALKVFETYREAA